MCIRDRITVDEAENAWKGTLEKVFKTVSSENDKEAADRDEKLYRACLLYTSLRLVGKNRRTICADCRKSAEEG